jgi:hypothetical protein
MSIAATAMFDSGNDSAEKPMNASTGLSMNGTFSI